MSWQDPGRTSSRPLACGPVPGYFSEYGTSCGEHSLPGDLVGPWVRAFVTATDVGLEPHGACTRMAAASGASPLIATIASMGKQMFGAAARRGGGSEGNDGSSPSPGVPSARPGGEPPHTHTPPPLPQAHSGVTAAPPGGAGDRSPAHSSSLGNEGCVLWASPWCVPSHLLGL